MKSIMFVQARVLKKFDDVSVNHIYVD